MDEYDEADARATVAEDWAHDARTDSGATAVLGKDAFFDSMFELADVWTESTKASEYVSFLANLLEAISYTDENGKRVFRRDEDIRIGCGQPNRQTEFADSVEHHGHKDGPRGEKLPALAPARSLTVSATSSKQHTQGLPLEPPSPGSSGSGDEHPSLCAWPAASPTLSRSSPAAVAKKHIPPAEKNRRADVVRLAPSKSSPVPVRKANTKGGNESPPFPRVVNRNIDQRHANFDIPVPELFLLHAQRWQRPRQRH